MKQGSLFPLHLFLTAIWEEKMATKNGMLQALAAESAPITATAPAAMSDSLQNRQRGLYQCLLNKAIDYFTRLHEIVYIVYNTTTIIWVRDIQNLRLIGTRNVPIAGYTSVPGA
jgi:hypothetical protein